MEETVALIEKYKARLNTQYEFKKVFRALQKLNEIEMTVDLLKATGVGKAVHKLRKEKALGEFSREIVAKWKNVANVGIQLSKNKGENYYASKVKSEPCSYDPAQNWKMDSLDYAKSNGYQPAKMKERNDSDEEYDPSRNWHCEGTQQEALTPPVRIKKEKLSPKPKKKWKNRHIENNVSDAETSRRPKDGRGVTVESITPTSPRIEEYDPSSNYVVSPTPNSDPESGQECHEEYDPGGSESAYRPNSMFSRSKLSDSEDSYPEDEPGAYLLHPQKSNESRPQERTSFVHSTTLYSRNKSVDSEDGSWGSKVDNLEDKKDDSCKKITKNKTLSPKNTSKVKSHKKCKIKIESSKTQKSSEKSKKRKSDENSKSGEQHSKKIKVEKHEVREANFLFEGIPVVANHKKKKSSKSKPDDSTKPKLNLHLPKIQASYRPLPAPEPVQVKRKDASLTDSQAAELHAKRQTKKMLVYSGGGGAILPKMMSLFDQCMMVLMNNIDAIDSFGGIPYEIVHPVLRKCTSEQLYRLEDSNPYLLEDTDALWQKHCANEFRSQRPDEMESWREMYLRLSDERDRKLASLTQIISMKEAKKKPLEKKVMLAYVGANAKPPRSVRRAQEKYGTAGRSRPSSSMASQSTSSSVRRDLVDSRMAVPVGSITAATVEREARMQQVREIKKPRIAPMMAKTLKSIGKMRFRR